MRTRSRIDAPGTSSLAGYVLDKKNVHDAGMVRLKHK